MTWYTGKQLKLRTENYCLSQNKVRFVNFMDYIMNYIISAYSTEHRSAASVLGRTHALRVPPSCCCTAVVNSGCKIKTIPFFLCLSSTQTKPNSTIKIGFGFTPESKGLMGCKHQLKTNQDWKQSWN